MKELPTTEMLDEDRELIKRCLHGTLRHDYKRNINKHVRLQEDNRKQGRWRAVLNSVLEHLAGKNGEKGKSKQTGRSHRRKNRRPSRSIQGANRGVYEMVCRTRMV